MASARIELKGAQSHNRRGRTFRRGVPQVITDEEAIAYCKDNAHLFTVVMMTPPKAAKQKAKPTRAKVKTPAARSGNGKTKAAEDAPL